MQSERLPPQVAAANDQERRKFTYKLNRYATVVPQILFLCGILGFCIWATITRREGFLGADAVLSLIVIVLGYLAYLQQIAGSDVTISRRGVRAAVFGWIWKDMEWPKVKCIIIRHFNVRTGLFRFENRPVYSICDFDPSKRGSPIVFGESIQGFPELLGLVQHYARQHNIPIIDNRPSS